MTSQVSLKGMIVKLVILARLWVVYLSQFVSPPTEPAPISVLFGGFSRKYLISVDGFHNNEVDAIDWFIHYLSGICRRTRKNTKASIPFGTCYMKSGICCSHNEDYIMLTLSKKKEEQERQQAKNGYWQNELDSLGIESKEKKVYNNTKEEL